jgi:hypothetical protein
MHRARVFWVVSSALVVVVGLRAAQSVPNATVTQRETVRAYLETVRLKADTTHANQTAPRTSIDRTLLDRYCVTCHNTRLKTGGLALDSADVNQVSANEEILEKVVKKLRSGQMPPSGARRPDRSSIDGFATALEHALDETAAASPNPGRFPIHRLNRVEYVNAIHDVLALDIDAAALLPADNSGLGFDNNADVLSVTPALMARYMSAATKISRLAVGDPAIRPVNQVFNAYQFGRQDSRASEDLPFGTHGGMAVRTAFPLDGEYSFKIKLQRNTVGNTIRGIEDSHEIELRLDRALVKRFQIGGEYKGSDPGILIAIPENEIEMQKLHTYRLTADKDLEIRIPVTAGTRTVAVAFTDRAAGVSERVPVRSQSIKSSVFSDDVGDPGIDSLEIAGPYNGKTPADTPSRQRIFACHPSGASAPLRANPAKEAGPSDEDRCARQILGALTRRAYRRPVDGGDLQPLMALYTAGRRERDFDTGIERALEGLLSSPAFLFRIERDPAGAKPGTVYRISDLELASRLSLFLWKSVPDEELIDQAVKQRLHDPAVLSAQVRRLLGDPKASRWMNDFIGQWLLIRNIQQFDPDPGLFPDFDDTLRRAMEKETELFFESQVRENHDVLDLLRADYTFLNDRLAQHYGVPNVYGGHFRRVTVTDPLRRGLLGQASVLSVTSYPNRTSVVLRGKWVLENLLGTPPPPPPPNVPPLKENDGRSKPTSLRERMEQHRESPTCATCHSHIDPMGFALENFDATGRWRSDDSGAPIDPTSTLSDGTKIDSPLAFREVLLNRGDQFVQTVTEKLFTYALGRGVEYTDAPTIRQIVREAGKDDDRWSSLVLALVNSKPFQMRRVTDTRD